MQLLRRYFGNVKLSSTKLCSRFKSSPRSLALFSFGAVGLAFFGLGFEGGGNVDNTDLNVEWKWDRMLALEKHHEHDLTFLFLRSFERAIDELPGSKQGLVYLRLAIHYSLGLGCTPQDIEKSVEYYEKATPLLLAHNDSGLHSYTLGLLYLNGVGGVDRSLEKSIQYLIDAMNARDEYSMNAVDCLATQFPSLTEHILKQLPSDSTRGDIWFLKYVFENDRDALAKSANLRYPLGLYCEARMLEAEEKYVVAFEKYKLAAQLGLSLALNQMGEFYEDGKYIHPDPERARIYYEKAMFSDDLDYPTAANNLACLYYNEKALAPRSPGVDSLENKLAAIKIWEDASKVVSDVFYIERNLGMVYHEGKFVPQDLEKSSIYYARAIDKGDVDSLMPLYKVESASLYQDLRSVYHYATSWFPPLE